DGYPEDIVGLEALKNYYAGNHKAFPDLHATIDEMIVKGDKMVVLWTITGTNTGPLGELLPTGKKVRFSGVAIDRVVNGKVVEEWVFWNVLDILQQLGFTLTPPQVEEPQ
ncbi:MAG: ester cyclase, partial [Candidatus Aminicenantes bacterium]|nr:ester cyclase [Candidatus Aminicenantes bacterium]